MIGKKHILRIVASLALAFVGIQGVAAQALSGRDLPDRPRVGASTSSVSQVPIRPKRRSMRPSGIDACWPDGRAGSAALRSKTNSPVERDECMGVESARPCG